MNPLLLIQLLGPLLSGVIQQQANAQVANQTPEATTPNPPPGIDLTALAALITALRPPDPVSPPEIKLPRSAAIVAGVVVVGFFLLLVAIAGLLVFGPQQFAPALAVLCVGFGVLASKFGTVVDYLFGSSWGSRAKDAAVASQGGQGGVIAVPVPQPAPAPLPKPAPVPAGPFSDAPAWFKWALHEVGTKEEPENRGQAIQRYIDLSHSGAQGDPWCAILANAALESSGVRGTRSPSSQSFRSDPNFVQLSGPALGAIAVFWRGTKDSGLGHVGFYRGEDASRVWALGGNEDDMVQIEALPKSSSSFGLIGYWWPKSVALPTIGPIAMPTGSPVSIKTDPTTAGAAVPAAGASLQTRIIATMLGDPENSAYTSEPIDPESFGVALPFRFTGTRPRVYVENANNTALNHVAEIVDVGPWNTNDPYWTDGKRPQAESGTDKRGRHTNGAGIDLTFAMAKALQIDGKGVVNWRFVVADPSEVKVT